MHTRLTPETIVDPGSALIPPKRCREPEPTHSVDSGKLNRTHLKKKLFCSPDPPPRACPPLRETSPTRTPNRLHTPTKPSNLISGVKVTPVKTTAPARAKALFTLGTPPKEPHSSTCALETSAEPRGRKRRLSDEHTVYYPLPLLLAMVLPTIEIPVLSYTWFSYRQHTFQTRIA